MPTQIRTLLIFATIAFGAGPLEARDFDESMSMLQEAMMESNADYNKHKKIANHDEFDRVETWGRRNAGTIVIDSKGATRSEINKFLKDYQIPQGNKTREDRETAAINSKN